MSEAALQPAYALHNRRYRESSLIVEFITRDHGRVAALAKGALGGKQPKQHLLQPFVPLLIDWRGRGDLPTLSSLEVAAHIKQPQGRALYCGLYVNELVLRLSERQDPHSELFPAYVECMSALLQAGNDNAALEPILRQFEVRLLDELGMGLQLLEDVEGRALQADHLYHYDLQLGARAPLGSEEKIHGASLLALASGRIEDVRQRQECRQLMRRVLATHLGGKPLKSRELFR